MARVRERTVDSDVVARLTAEGVHPVLARLYAARQVRCLHDVNTDLAGLLTPERLRGVQDAARWLLTAIHDKKRILVVADYDADGATACAVAVRGLRRFGADVDYLVPDRFTLGYSLTPALIDHALTLHVDAIDCIVTVDNGISSIDGVAHANAKGIDVLVTDHHLPGPTLPDALIVNPNQPGCSFPSKHLAGVGVMFYVLLALRQYVRDHAPSTVASLPRMDDLLPIVALGTVADVVRLDANNRRLVDQGLQRLRQGKGVAGLNALFQVAQIDVRQANANHLGFAIGPRINAAGRLSDMSIGIQCLLEDDPERALELAQALDQLNRERRDIESTAREEAIERAVAALAPVSDSASASPSERMTVVLHDPNWHPGVIGLMAGRIKDMVYRPAIVFANDSNALLVKGSARSIPGVHIRDVLERIDTQHPGLIKTFGGHAMAAGLTLPVASLDRFASVFDATVREFAEPGLLEQILETDGVLAPEFLRLDLAKMLTEHVWGQGFPPPVFVNEFRVLGQRRLKEAHLKLDLATSHSATASRSRIEAIWFNAPTDLGDTARLAYRLAVNDWQGRSSLQLEVVGLA